MKKLDFPINRCTIDLTEKCNLRCTYCFTYPKGSTRRDLDFKQGKKTIDWLFKDEICQSDELQIDWWGGEPLLKFELLKRLSDYAIEKAQREKKRLMIGGTTNTTLVTKEVVDWMNNHRTYFMLSIDGIKEIQDKYRPTRMNSSSWDELVRNLPYIVEKIPFIRSRSAPTPETIGRMFSSMKEIREKWKITTQMFSPVFEMDWTDKDFAVAEEQMKMLADYIIDVRKKGERFEVKHFDDGCGHLESGKNRREMPCGAGRFYVGISVDGFIYPCHRFNKYDGKKPYDKYCIGSVDEGITRPDLRESFIKFLDYPVIERCRNCKWLGNLCDISCYAVNYDLTGDIKTPPEKFCKWQEALSNSIVYFHKKLKENNLPIIGFGQNLGIGQGGRQMKGSCICNNMCYSEGTEHEIKVVDWENKFGCHCYSTNYAAGLGDQARNLTEEEMLAIKPMTGGSIGVSQEGSKLLQNLNEKLDKMETTNKNLTDAISTLTELLKSKL